MARPGEECSSPGFILGTNMIQLFPISKPSVDWNNYLPVAKQIMGEDIAADAASVSKHSSQAFHDTLIHLLGEKALKHLHYAFMLLGQKDFVIELLEHQDIVSISVTQTPELAFYLGILSGSLFRFKQLILILNWNKSSRMLSNKLQEFFENTENIYIFSEYSKQSKGDGTYQLCKLK